MYRDPTRWPEGAAGERALADRPQSEIELERIREHIPEGKLARILKRFADRCVEIDREKDSASLELHTHFHAGKFNRARFDPDERIA